MRRIREFFRSSDEGFANEFKKGNGLDIIEKVIGYVKGNISIRISEKFEILIELPLVKK